MVGTPELRRDGQQDKSDWSGNGAKEDNGLVAMVPWNHSGQETFFIIA